MVRAILVLIFSLLLTPMVVEATTLTFQEKNWNLDIGFTKYQTPIRVRGNFTLDQLLRASVLGEEFQNLSILLSSQTVLELENIAQTINQQPENAQLLIENNRATTFNPGKSGQVLDTYALLQELQTAKETVPLPVLTAKPQIGLAETNVLGINELVALGESNFKGSPRNRTFNIRVGADKFNGLIIQPGEEFSFNKYLGEVDGEHGFLPELVIKRQGVIPEFGGGLCQVSSTAFRAAMNAGMPITERRNHSFAVQYYAPQGTDATIYPGSTDLKFINDFKSPILVRTKIEGTQLYFEYYGTKDDRTVAFKGPIQYDKKPDGSMKATWTRHVTNNGQNATQIFKSTYLPPALSHPETPPLTPPQTP